MWVRTGKLVAILKNGCEFVMAQYPILFSTYLPNLVPSSQNEHLLYVEQCRLTNRALALTQKHSHIPTCTDVRLPGLTHPFEYLLSSLFLSRCPLLHWPPSPCHSLYSFRTPPALFLISAAFSHLSDSEAGSHILFVFVLFVDIASILFV